VTYSCTDGSRFEQVIATSDDTCQEAEAEPRYDTKQMSVLLRFTDVCNSGLTAAQQGGIAAGFILFVALVVGVAYILWRLQKSKAQESRKKALKKLEAGMN